MLEHKILNACREYDDYCKCSSMDGCIGAHRAVFHVMHVMFAKVVLKTT